MARPLGALVSQGIVAASSLALQFIALNKLGASGLGSFSLLFGILITVNSIQSGWIGDSLTVLDRFEPGIRRALLESQLVVVVAVGAVTTLLALPVGGVDATTALLFGLASVMWVIEETLRRLLIARREFWKLVVNDASFAAGSLGMVAFTALTGSQFTLESLIASLFAGAVVAIGVGVTQLPRIELSRGLLAHSRMRELSSFAFWRAAQVGLRPGSQAIVRAVVATVASLEALGQLETARLLLAPMLTAVNGAGVFLLPTYSSQARRREPFRPRVGQAMAAVGATAALYGVFALVVRQPLLDLFGDGTTVVTATALGAWTLYAIGFGAGVPVGNAMVAGGRSRTAFRVRSVDAVVGIGAASAIALAGWVDAAPAGLALGTLCGAWLLVRELRRPVAETTLEPPQPATRRDDVAGPTDAPPVADPRDDAPLVWQPVAPDPGAPWRSDRAGKAIAPRIPAVLPTPRTTHGEQRVAGVGRRGTLQQRLLWLAPLVMIVATEYKVRRRSIDDALSGSVDPLIAVELLIYGVVGLWAVWRLAPVKPRATPLTVVLWGYILTTAVSALYSTFPLLAMARAVQLVIIGVAIQLLATQGTTGTMRRLLHGWVVLMSVSILMGIAYVSPKTSNQEGRFTWLSVHSVSTGSMLAVSVCVVFGLWLSARTEPLPWPRWMYGLVFAFQLLFLVLTRTRGSIGGAAVAIAAMAWLWSGTRMKPQLLLGCLVAGGAATLAFGAQIVDYLTRGESAESIGTFNRRTEIWSLAWESFFDRPLHGLGFTSAKGVFFDETGLGGAHNALVNVMIDVGLVGLAWWIGLIAAVVVTLGRQWNRREAEAFPVFPTAAMVGDTPRGPAPGAAGSRRADHLIVLGILVASLINGVTTEGLGVGVNVSAIWLFILVAWLAVLDGGAEAAAAATPTERALVDH